MVQFKAFGPKVEVSGAAVLSILKGMEQFRALAENILSKHGIKDVSQDKWYPQQPWLDAFKEVAEKIGPMTLKVIGQKIPETALWPDSINNIEEALASIDKAYHLNHRNGEIGNYTFEKTGDCSGKMICFNPYPCMFDLGLIEATAKKFSHPGKNITITHDKTRPCRQRIGESCTYIISW